MAHAITTDPHIPTRVLSMCRAAANNDQERQGIKAEADSIVGALFDLDKQVANASYFLPAFEIRNSAEVTAGMRQRLGDARSRLLPRRKFCFSKPSVIIEVQDPLDQVRHQV